MNRLNQSAISAPFAIDWLTRQPYRDLHPRFLNAVERFATWPTPEQYDQLAAQVPRVPGALPHFVTENRTALRAVGGYERHVERLSAVPTRPGHWHDFFNMAVWAHFPALRWALNALHVDPNAGPIDARNGRAPAQNSAASFDESGMIVLSTSRAVLEELRALRFRHAFWELRAEVLETTRFWVVGHGLLESLLAPRPGFIARSVQIQLPALPTENPSDELRFEVDALIAAHVRAWRTARPVLDPVPVLAIPGFSDNDSADFYDDLRNIRFVPISRRPEAHT